MVITLFTVATRVNTGIWISQCTSYSESLHLVQTVTNLASTSASELSARLLKAGAGLSDSMESYLWSSRGIPKTVTFSPTPFWSEINTGLLRKWTRRGEHIWDQRACLILMIYIQKVFTLWFLHWASAHHVWIMNCLSNESDGHLFYFKLLFVCRRTKLNMRYTDLAICQTHPKTENK